eukprot:CAMPEP_0197840246 /NCGR_PEP_ID=MMETSP1437-20131217/45495_1 /TAXON_ID=49252 ORGANISM="Eucampia antarctica, Strain CCMP1452" /NCGR_SAMPLE_ID=MMETSP1437 /ASSEMBLY_ACC=CAM_ASM_001096 /LENGTH=88 /DNA_ID=CAMNT_0043449827 /DNA_START=921 /DNA_END=1184 /DNA_ORIENTATION=+
MEYATQSSWIVIPHDSKDRNDLKLHFRTCAEREMDFLGLEQRRYEIPTLIVIDSLTRSILTTGGIQDIKQHPTIAGGTPKDVDILTNW